MFVLKVEKGNLWNSDNLICYFYKFANIASFLMGREEKICDIGGSFFLQHTSPTGGMCESSRSASAESRNRYRTTASSWVLNAIPKGKTDQFIEHMDPVTWIFRLKNQFFTLSVPVSQCCWKEHAANFRSCRTSPK